MSFWKKEKQHRPRPTYRNFYIERSTYWLAGAEVFKLLAYQVDSLWRPCKTNLQRSFLFKN